MKKALVFILVLLVVIGGGAWYFTTFKLDSMIEEQVEQAGTASFGAPVSIGKLETDIPGGALRIADITVANPSGFRNANAFTLRDIEVALDYGTFDVKRVIINKPEIVIEEKGGKTNFDVMMERLNSGEQVEVETPEGVEEPVITIRHFRLAESRAAFESESMDRYTDLEIDEVELRNLKGTPSEVATIVAEAVLTEITKEAATEMLKAKAREKYDDVVKDVFGGKDDS